MEDDEKIMQNALVYGTEKIPMYRPVTSTEMAQNSSFFNESLDMYLP